MQNESLKASRFSAARATSLPTLDCLTLKSSRSRPAWWSRSGGHARPWADSTSGGQTHGHPATEGVGHDARRLHQSIRTQADGLSESPGYDIEIKVRPAAEPIGHLTLATA